MKTQLLVSIVLIFFISNSIAQNAKGFGFKGGLNYNANGKYTESINSIAVNPDRNIGYHFGVFAKIGGKVFFKPELVYTKTKSDYNNASFSMQKLDAPVLVGYKFLRILNVFAGPSFQYILDTEFKDIAINTIKNEFSVGVNFGIGVSVNKIGIDLRYERGFSKNEATFLDNNSVDTSRIETRPDQLILSVSLIL